MPQTLIPTLHHLSHSAAFRCLWALEELKEANGIKYNLKNYYRRRGQAPPELKEVFPLGKSPILTLESTTDEPVPTIQVLPGVLTEAQLILRFLSDEYGQGLWEVSSEDKNRDTFFQGFAVMTLSARVDHLVVIEALITLLPFGLSYVIGCLLSPLISFWKKSSLEPIFQFLDDALDDERPWFSGRKFGLADFNVCWGIDMASQRGYLEKGQFTKLDNWHRTVKARRGYVAALELGNGYDLKTFGI
ncbi:hypothetical protein GQX73_g6255 [Xylaria multiplex]|uniref:GST N-terminal domain-containing protein n=1 Tax=Xylaria multiplex TaxID=323545 RepID=A0A7C8MSK8_9PEZI|nr:hypothetical protein GQX73_g6255 [Xylaria multiplex]